MQLTVQQALKKIIRAQPDSASWAAKAFQNTSKKNKLSEAKRRDLIRQESQIGAKLFGEIQTSVPRSESVLELLRSDLRRRRFGTQPRVAAQRLPWVA